ncbi:MAG: hypothetical protein MZV63_58830 [Marinilabiliales bacterium]|nr:hypothetical protein [Marinilabiliales bacterium]
MPPPERANVARGLDDRHPLLVKRDEVQELALGRPDEGRLVQIDGLRRRGRPGHLRGARGDDPRECESAHYDRHFPRVFPHASHHTHNPGF